jgi:hypothetical protein
MGCRLRPERRCRSASRRAANRLSGGVEEVLVVEVVRSAHQLDNGGPDVAARAERESWTVMTDTWSAAAS